MRLLHRKFGSEFRVPCTFRGKEAATPLLFNDSEKATRTRESLTNHEGDSKN
jgi:hypothetical protein